MPPELNNHNQTWIQSLVSSINPKELYIEVNEDKEVSYINKDEYELSQTDSKNKLNKKYKENIEQNNLLKNEINIDNKIKELQNIKKEKIKEEKEKIKEEKERIKKEKEQEKKLEQEEKKLEKEMEKLNKQKTLIKYKNDADNNYLEVEAEFNKKHFKVIKQSLYCSYENFELQTFKKGNFEVSYNHKTYDSIDKNGNPIDANFISRYMKSKTSRVYEDMNIYANPKLCPHNHFNLWLPFAIENMKCDDRNEEGVKFILNHILILCNNDKEVAEYVIDWISHLFQRPYEKSTFLLFVSQEGIGKSTIFSKLLKSMIGVSKFFSTTNPQNNILGEFNEALINSFLIVFEEMEFLNTRGCMGSFKTLITNDEIYINPKGSKGFMTKSVHRACGNTNNININIPTEEGDRRKCMIKCSNEKKGDVEYMKKLHFFCEDPATMKSFYEFCMGRDVKDFISKPIPLTAYQEELQKYYESPVQSFLKKKVCYFYHNSNKKIQEYSFSKLYKDFNYWLCCNNEKISYTKRKFSLELGNLEFDGFKKEKKSGDIICVFDIYKLLELWNIQLDNVDKELVLLEQEENN